MNSVEGLKIKLETASCSTWATIVTDFKKVGIAQSTISAVLNGSRKLTKAHVLKLAEFFNVAPAAFLPSGVNVELSDQSTGAGGTKSAHRIAAASQS